MQTVKIIECSRDAMQGIKSFIPTEVKADYINLLLKVGFDIVDFGSFVSPKAIPQMRDTASVLKLLDLTQGQSKLLAIVANVRGANDAVCFEEIDYLGYPFSISENFQMRNTGKTITQSRAILSEIISIAHKKNKEVVTYLSMGFGNPYGDPYSAEIVADYTEQMVQMGVKVISLSDTIGSAETETIDYLFKHLIPLYPDIEFGAHLHTTPAKAALKIDAAYRSGCRRFDTAIKGYGGCPMAKDELTGNLPTEKLLDYFKKNGIATAIDKSIFQTAFKKAGSVF